MRTKRTGDTRESQPAIWPGLVAGATIAALAAYAPRFLEWLAR